MLVGGWRLFDFRIVDEQGAVVLHPQKSDGFLLYTADGYVAGSMMSSGEHFLAYFGHYTVTDDRIVHQIKVSSDRALVGTEGTRFARMEGESLILVSKPSLIGGPGTAAEIVWRRELPVRHDKSA